MILDDDVLFHNATNVGRLIGHLRADPTLALVAACHHPHDCYAHSFVVEGSTVHQRAVRSEQAAGLHLSDITHNVFVARAPLLKAHPWDERQQMLEHETFFLNLKALHYQVGFDPAWP